MKNKKKMRGIISIVFIIIVIAAIGNMNNDKPKAVDTTNGSNNTATSAPTKEAEKTEFAVGETVSLSDVLATLVSVTASEGSNILKPADGKVFLLCEFNIENNSSKDLAISSMLSFEAYCDDYSITQSLSGLMEKGDKSQLDGSIAAGKKMNGVIAYEVPADWKELEIKFTPDVWSNKNIKFVATND